MPAHAPGPVHGPVPAHLRKLTGLRRPLAVATAAARASVAATVLASLTAAAARANVAATVPPRSLLLLLLADPLPRLTARTPALLLLLALPSLLRCSRCCSRYHRGHRRLVAH
jgi:hypothetical protein